MDTNHPKGELDNAPAVESAVPPSNNTIPLSNRYQIAATSDNTRRAYQADIRHFENWGGQLPATTEAVLRYLHAFAETLNPRTLGQITDLPFFRIMLALAAYRINAYRPSKG